MRLLADMHIAPRTVALLQSLGHDVVRVNDVLPHDAADDVIVEHAATDGRTLLTQDLDFSAVIALTGKKAPSLISLRLSSSRIEHVNAVLEKILPAVEQDVAVGMVITVEDERVRCRRLPIGEGG